MAWYVESKYDELQASQSAKDAARRESLMKGDSYEIARKESSDVGRRESYGAGRRDSYGADRRDSYGGERMSDLLDVKNM